MQVLTIKMQQYNKGHMQLHAGHAGIFTILCKKGLGFQKGLKLWSEIFAYKKKISFTLEYVQINSEILK